MVRVVATLAFFAAVALYLAPSAITILRAQSRGPLVVAINVLLGWTILGWVAALAMSLEMRLPRRAKRRTPRAQVSSAPVAARSAAPDRADTPPAREPVEPPKLPDESYAHWLDNGSAMKA